MKKVAFDKNKKEFGICTIYTIFFLATVVIS